MKMQNNYPPLIRCVTAGGMVAYMDGLSNAELWHLFTSDDTPGLVKVLSDAFGLPSSEASQGNGFALVQLAILHVTAIADAVQASELSLCNALRAVIGLWRGSEEPLIIYGLDPVPFPLSAVAVV